MPTFTDPFPGIKLSPAGLMSESGLVRAMRLDLAAEEEAVNLYTAHADAADNTIAKTMLLEVADDERRHIGVFQRLIEILAGEMFVNGEKVNERSLNREGMAEISKRFPKIAGVDV